MTDSNHSSDTALDALFASARARHPDTSRQEYGFETRLLSRLRAARRPDRAAWTFAAWRLIPFFGIFVLALTLWQAKISSDAQEAELAASIAHPEAVELWDNLN
jgi:hypothetical protein